MNLNHYFLPGFLLGQRNLILQFLPHETARNDDSNGMVNKIYKMLIS
jgi:hypothetical protein